MTHCDSKTQISFRIERETLGESGWVWLGESTGEGTNQEKDKNVLMAVSE